MPINCFYSSSFPFYDAFYNPLYAISFSIELGSKQLKYQGNEENVDIKTEKDKDKEKEIRLSLPWKDNNTVWNLPLPCKIDLLGTHNQTFDIKVFDCTTKLHMKHFICYLYREYTSM